MQKEDFLKTNSTMDKKFRNTNIEERARLITAYSICDNFNEPSNNVETLPYLYNEL